MTLLEYKKLWALPADIRAREKRIQVLRKKLDNAKAVEDTVQACSEASPYSKHTLTIRGVESGQEKRLIAELEKQEQLNVEYDQLHTRALLEVEDITDPEVRAAVSRRSFEGWSWEEIARDLAPSRDANAVRMAVDSYFKKNPGLEL